MSPNKTTMEDIKMTQYKTASKEDVGEGILKLTFEDKHFDTNWAKSIDNAVKEALVEQGHFEKVEDQTACWNLTVWVDTLASR